MFVFTSVIVTLTPGNAKPDASTMLPTRPPLTAWALTVVEHATTSAAADTHAASVRPKRRAMSILQLQSRESGVGADLRLWTAYRPATTDDRLQTRDSRLPTRDYSLPTTLSVQF